jgi:membrane-associated phospholipid phosphatase
MVSGARLALTAARPVERLLAGYSVVVIGLCLARGGRFPGLGWIAAAHGLVLVLLLLLQRVGTDRFGALLRDFAPVVILLGLYGAIDVINGGGAVRNHDRVVQSWEAMLFGGQPARDWWHRWPSRAASWIFHAAYFSYYLIVPFPLVYFLATRRAELARRAIFPILVAFVLCYLGFLFFPVAGPYYEFERPLGGLVENGPARLVYAVLAGGSSYGAAFPSSHVAATWAAVVAVGREVPRVGAALAVPATLLTVGVVYCQMHYAVDAIAGLGVAVLALASGGYFDSYRSR